MQIEPLGNIPPKLERPASTGAAASAATETNLLSNNPETPVQPVEEAEKPVSINSNRGETIWSESDRRAVFRVLNENTGEVVAQIPSDEVLRVARNIQEFVANDTKKNLDIET